jgi:hypothetical protein
MPSNFNTPMRPMWPIGTATDVRIVCWSHDERKVLVSIKGGKHTWMPVEFDNPADTMSRGYILVDSERICVFA